MKTNLLSNHEKNDRFNKKSITIILVLIVIGSIIGMLTSTYFLNDANQDIAEWNRSIDEWTEKWQNFSWDNHSWENHNHSDSNDTDDVSSSTQYNSSWSGFYQKLTPLNFNDVLLPVTTTILLCITSLILLGLIVTYLKIFKDTKSKYILGLLLVLTPLLIVSTFLIRIVKSLYFSSALEFSLINTFFGFGINGIGGMISILSVFMIVGVSVLFYLSNE